VPEDLATGATSLRENGAQLAGGTHALCVPSALVSLFQRAASMAALLITTEVMVAEKTDKTASPMLNGGMAEAGF
jgi:hypothetical protein